MGFFFIHFFLSLILNSAFASLGSDDYLETLNPKLLETDANSLKEPAQFSKIKNKENQFSQLVIVHVRTKGQFSIRFSQSTISTGSHSENRYENRVKNQVRI
jgi:hypothetical protein